MISKILKDYEKQSFEHTKSILKQIGYEDEKDYEFEKMIPKSNYDLIKIFESIRLIKDPEKATDDLYLFYEETLMRGIIYGISLGKMYVVNECKEGNLSLDEIEKIDSSLYSQYFPRINSSEDLGKEVKGMEGKEFKDLDENEKIDVAVEAVIKTFNEISEIDSFMANYHYYKLFRRLNISADTAKTIANKKIKLSPDSKRLPLISLIFKDKKGKFKFKDLIKEYCSEIFYIGNCLGVRNGMKIIIDDIQNERICYDNIIEKNDDELADYLYKETKEDLEKYDV